MTSTIELHWLVILFFLINSLLIGFYAGTVFTGRRIKALKNKIEEKKQEIDDCYSEILLLKEMQKEKKIVLENSESK